MNDQRTLTTTTTAQVSKNISFPAAFNTFKGSSFRQTSPPPFSRSAANRCEQQPPFLRANETEMQIPASKEQLNLSSKLPNKRNHEFLNGNATEITKDANQPNGRCKDVQGGVAGKFSQSLYYK